MADKAKKKKGGKKAKADKGKVEKVKAGKGAGVTSNKMFSDTLLK